MVLLQNPCVYKIRHMKRFKRSQQSFFSNIWIQRQRDQEIRFMAWLKKGFHDEAERGMNYHQGQRAFSARSHKPQHDPSDSD